MYRITAQDIYEQSLAPLYEQKGKDKDYANFFLPFLNATLQETLPHQNNLLLAQGKEKLAVAPIIKSMDEIVEYEEVLTRGAIPLNISAMYFADDNNNSAAQDYRARYINAISEATVAIESAIEDIY